jgi:4-oxalocrotonate tautomerase
MPIIEVTLVEGRTPERLHALIAALTDAACGSLDAPRDSVRVVLREVPATHFAAGGVTIAERRAADPAAKPDEHQNGAHHHVR